MTLFFFLKKVLWSYFVLKRPTWILGDPNQNKSNGDKITEKKSDDKQRGSTKSKVVMQNENCVNASDSSESTVIDNKKDR
jgi:hypothetical protein